MSRKKIILCRVSKLATIQNLGKFFSKKVGKVLESVDSIIKD